MAGNGGNSAGRSVTSKVGAVLSAFLPSSRELSLNSLAQRAGLPVTTTYRLACELVEWGGLERAERGGYRVGPRLEEIGSLAVRGTTIRELALDNMKDLWQATGHGIQLAVLAGREAVCIERIAGRPTTTGRTDRGGRMPLHATAAGKILLAFSSPALTEEVMEPELKRFTSRTIVERELMLRAFAEIRRTGVGFARDELATGSASVAAPVFDAWGDVVAALAIECYSSRMNLRRLAPAVQTAAIGASRQLQAHRHTGRRSLDRVRELSQ